MAFTITNDATGAEFSYASEVGYGLAEDWYNRTAEHGKDLVVDFCKGRGVDLLETSPATGKTMLVADWEDRAMHCYARSVGLAAV